MIDSGGGGASVFDAVGSSMKTFASVAKSGGVAVSDAGGKAMLEAIRNMKDWVDGNKVDVSSVSMRLPLGDSQGARVMRPFVEQVATDNQGFLPMLMKFRESLEDAEQGIKDAMRNYREMDQQGAGRMQSA